MWSLVCRRAAALSLLFALVGGPAWTQGRTPEQRRALRWELVKTELYHYDFLKRDYFIGATGFGDARRPKVWRITATSAHVQRTRERGGFDATWSRPPITIVKGQPFTMTLRVSAKDHGWGGVTVSPYFDFGLWSVRVVPPGGKLPDLAVDAPVELKAPAIPPDLPFLRGVGPMSVELSASDDPADKLDAETTGTVQVQLQDQGRGTKAFLAVNVAGLGMVLYCYEQTPVAGQPDRSKAFWLDRDWGPAGVNTMLQAQGLKIGENYTVTLNGHKLLTRRVPAELRDISMTEEVSAAGGYRSGGHTAPPRPNTKGEIPPHEWLWIPTETEPGPVMIVVEAEKSGKFELPFKVTADPVGPSLLDRYGETIPPNTALLRALAQPGRLRDWIGRAGGKLASAGAINNMFFAGGAPFVGGPVTGNFQAYTCGGYQGQVLALLNFLRFNDDVGLRRSLDGWEFGPFQASFRTHHFAGIWPTHAKGSTTPGNWKEAAFILDPWIEQQPRAYPIKDYVAAHWGVQPDDYGPGGGTYYHGGYPLTGGMQYQDPFVAAEGGYRYQDPLKRRILIACPVTVMLTNAAGQKLGVAADGTTVAEIPGSFVTSAQDGQRSFLFCLPDDTYTIEITGAGPGQVGIACGADEAVQLLPEFAITAGGKAQLKLAGPITDWTATGPDGKVLQPERWKIPVVPFWSVTLKGAKAGVPVRLKAKAEGIEQVTVETDAQGVAWFGGVVPGDYLVEFEGPASQGRRVDATVKLGDTGIEPPWDGPETKIEAFEPG